eukprot:gnl/MRDRNA2_/MRDRNA2_206197_c0_seq1.p1 gnl/MRDRNA2_/MRDRNA2_206197_c0~~gnl/MRDRNA2_/MRDRNA2_206197_c0_seq1.p1  ORF type:complete len:162 (+),score=46.20 gnl/MRDRNA2_/MRDRNA2_206197_c0_seq1:51-536(+)
MNFPPQTKGLPPKMKGLRSLSIDPETCNGEGGSKKGPQVFAMGTPPGEKVKSHFIGTPTADGILSAFLSFDCDDAAPPLDFDDCCVGDATFKGLQRGESAKSLGSESTKSSRGQGPDCDERPTTDEVQLGAEDEPETEEEEYADDFEAESDDDEAIFAMDR